MDPVLANLIGQRELVKLDRAGIAYRLPVPGAKVKRGVLKANIALPGLVIQYSTDGGSSWKIYDNDKRPKVKGDVLIRSVSPDGQRYSRIDHVKA